MTSVIWDGWEFPSVDAAADYARVTSEHMARWLELGYSCTDDVIRPRPVNLGGLMYPSIAEAARDLGVARVTIWRWLENGS